MSVARSPWFRRPVLTAALLALFLPSPSGAQEPGPPSPDPAAAADRYTLSEAVAAGLRGNRNLAVERLELERAEQQVEEAYGGLFPEIDGTLAYQRNLLVQEAFLPAFIFDPDADPGELVPVQFGADNQWTASISVQQPLFDGRVLIGVSTAGAFKGLQVEVVRGRAQQVATNVRQAYYDVLLAREALRVTENSVGRVEQTLDETEALNEAGLASSYDVLRLEVQLANLRPNLRRTTNAITEAERRLSLVMGTERVGRAEALGSLYLVDITGDNLPENRALLEFAGFAGAADVDVERLVAVALERRSDLRQARLQEELENAQLKLAKAELLPRLNAFFNFSFLAQESGSPSFFGEEPNQRTSSAAVGVQLEVPIFSGFERLNRVEQRQLVLRQAETRVVDLEQQVRDQITTLADDLREARARTLAQQQAVGEAERGYEIISAEYLAGTGSRLEVTDAELALRQAEQNYAIAVYDYLSAQAALDLALGVVPLVDPVMGASDTRRAEGATGDRTGERDSN